MVKKVGFDDEGPKLGFGKHWFELSKHSLVDAFNRMFDFSGRTSRAPFWIAFILFGFCSVYSLACEIWASNWGLGDFEIIVRSAFKGARYFFLYLLFPLLVRRYHDVGKSILAALNPFDAQGNTLGIASYLFESGDSKANKYGAPHSL